MARHILDIFLSSTSEDLRDYRTTVTDVLGRLGQFVVRMESFGAKPDKPLEQCRREVAQSDALIVVVGHRYGWIPSKAEGGDDTRSITWWEVQWALDAGKPVYAFLIDPTASWSGPREQDRVLGAATQAETLAVWRAVRGLQAFRSMLESRTTRALFSTPDRLGALVVTSLFPWLLEQVSPVRATAPQDLKAAAVVPADAAQPPIATRARRLPDQLYWHEQVHVLSARELIADAPQVRAAIIAGRPRVSHPSLSNVPITAVGIDGAVAARAGDDYTTALCALVAAAGGAGFDGVAPGTELLAISLLDEHHMATNASIASGIDRAVLGGARVICLALGSTEASAIIADAIRDAVDAGVTIVAAAGNGNSDLPHHPAALDNVIAVGAVDATGEPTPYTSYGTWVDIMAPGHELSLPAGEDGYAPSSGTSWSCAIVTGIVALMLKAAPALTPADVKDVLTRTAQPVKGGRNGGVIVDAYAAVRRAAEGPSHAASPAAAPGARAARARRPRKP